MRSSTLKLIVLLATILTTLIVIVQLYWLKKVYSYEEKQFQNNVVKSIRGVFEDLQMNDNPAMIFQQLIANPSPNYIVFKADTLPLKDSLSFYLQREFTVFDLFTDCKLGAFSKDSQKYIYAEYIPAPASSDPVQEVSDLPVLCQGF
jgi:two-component system phosphate regulon sensor histidine kinase PhoR